MSNEVSATKTEEDNKEKETSTSAKGEESEEKKSTDGTNNKKPYEEHDEVLIDLEGVPKFDPTRLKEIAEGDKSFETELITIYKEACEEKYPLLQEALKNEHYENSVLYSHDIKGSSANMGTEAVRRVSEKMEMLSRSKNYKEASKLLPILKTSLHETYVVLDSYLSDSPSS